MSRDWTMYWDDILVACRKIIRFTSGINRDEFFSDERTYDAVLRNHEVIGEATKNLPESVRKRAPMVEWRKIAGLRDIIAHGYFGIDKEILWNVVSEKIPQLLPAMEAMAAESDQDQSK